MLRKNRYKRKALDYCTVKRSAFRLQRSAFSRKRLREIYVNPQGINSFKQLLKCSSDLE
jgi:hypothetical protein